jgi:hypothetical protein
MFAKLQKATISFIMPACLPVCLSVCLYGTTQLPLDRFLWNLQFQYFSKICQENSSFIKISLEMGTLHKDQHTFLIISCSILLEMRNVSDKSCTEKQNTHLCSITFFKKLCHLWDNVEKHCRGLDRPQTTIWCMRTNCWIYKANNTHSESATLNGFPQQQWLHEHASVLRYTYISCRVQSGTSFLPLLWSVVENFRQSLLSRLFLKTLSKAFS